MGAWSHWLVGLAFVVVQAVTFRRYCRLIPRVLDDWQTWCAKPDLQFVPRSELLDVLHSRLHETSPYLLLSRLGTMAPLVGVIVTAIGFINLSDLSFAGSPATQAADAPGPLAPIRPLFYGVLLGSLLALLNQLLMQLAAGRAAAAIHEADTRRMRTRSVSLPSHIAQDFSARAAEAAGSVERVVQQLADVVQVMMSQVSALGDACRDGAAAVGETFDLSRRELGTTCQALASSAGQVIRDLDEAGGRIRQATGEYAGHAGTFATESAAMVKGLDLAGREVKKLATALAASNRAAEKRDRLAEDRGRRAMDAAADVITAGKNLAGCVRDDLAPAVKLMKEQVGAGTALVEGMVRRAADTVDSMADHVGAAARTASEAGDGAARLGGAVDSLGRVVDALADRVASLEQSLADAEQSVRNTAVRAATSGAARHGWIGRLFGGAHRA